MNRKSRITLGSVALVTALIVTGCSSGTAGAPAPTQSGATSAQGKAAQALIDEASQPVDAFIPPGPAFDVSSIAGGTVYYIVPALEVAVFQHTKEVLEDVFSRFDVSLQQCGTNGSSPDGISNCLTQSVDAGASAVMAMGIPYELAPTAFDAVTAAGIPLLYALTAPAGPGDPTKVGYFTPDLMGLQTLNAMWVIADSDATANVLVIKETDNPAIAAWTEVAVLPTYEEACSDCTVKVLGGSTSMLDKITTDVTASLVADPTIEYIQVPAETYLAVAIAGVQAAGKTTDDIKIISMDATPSSIAQLQEGQWLASTGGSEPGANGWYMADQVARMMAGQPSIPNVKSPYVRVFTRENVADLEPTEAAWASGEWYGDSDFKSGFLELWGLQ